MHFLPLVLALAPQGGEAPPARSVNRVELIVNTDLITRRQLVRQLTKAREQRPVTTNEEALRLQVEIVQGAMESLLLRQAGEDLGQPKEAVERVLENVWKNQIERSGGLQEFSLESDGQDQSTLERREKLESDIYTWTYTRVVTGNEPGRDGRVIADRYIRPGTRRRLYDYMGRTSDGLGRIGGRPMTIVMQELVLLLEPGGEQGERRERIQKLHAEANALRERALAGEDFNALVNEFGALKGSGSLHPDLPLDRLRRSFPALADFALGASVGDISPVLAVRDTERGPLQGWRVVRILESRPAEPPPFDDLVVQRILERVAEDQLDARRRDDALPELLRSAYVWSPDLERARAEAAAREAEAASTAALQP
jgi:hypothetical protein